MENRGLSELVERVLSGDAQSYEELYLQTKDNVYFHAKTALLSEETAWDIVQNTYTAAFRSLSRLKTPETAETWLCAIAGNLCFSRLHKQKSTTEQVHRGDDTLRGRVEDGLAALTDMQRIAVLFRYCDDMSLAQIGTVLRCGEGAVGTLLADAERVLGISRETAPGAPKGDALTPTVLKTGLMEIKADTRLSPAVTLGVAEALAQKCGYKSTLRIVPGVSPQGGERLNRPAKTDSSANDEPVAVATGRGSDAPRPGVDRARRNARKSAMALASGLVVVGLVVGAFSVRAIIDARSADDLTPDNLDALFDENAQPAVHSAADPDGDAAAPADALTVEAAQAYIGIISDYTGRFGVCASPDTGAGLAYAELIDFDGDGRQELYLYYIDNAFSPENETYRLNAAGEEQWCLHEQLWSFDGALTLIYEQEHCGLAPVDSAEGASRWLCTGADGRTRFFAWYSYTDENGYINHSSTVYELRDGALTAVKETTAMFVVANAANQRRDGYLIEEYYGTDNSHFDDIGYFVEGAITTADGRTSFNYEQCQALLDIGTADVVPISPDNSGTPIGELAEAYVARQQGTQLITSDGATLTWATNDVNAFLSTLADICTGN